MNQLDVALKEWAVVCDLLLAGKLALMLRKGGIAEKGGPGRFAMEHQRFALFPSWVHQKPGRIKEPYRPGVIVCDHEPQEVALAGFGVVEPQNIWQVPSREAFDALKDLHCWTQPQIDMRFSYKPDRPLYLMAVRAYRLAQGQTVAMRPVYAGCKSWVALDEDDTVETSNSAPALDDDAFTAIVSRIESAMGQVQPASH
jgi:hypothetical protein